MRKFLVAFSLLLCGLQAQAQAQGMDPSMAQYLPGIGPFIARLLVGSPIPIVICEDLVDSKYTVARKKKDEAEWAEMSTAKIWAKAEQLVKEQEHCRAAGTYEFLSQVHRAGFLGEKVKENNQPILNIALAKKALALSAQEFLLAGDAFEAERQALLYRRTYPGGEAFDSMEQVVLLSMTNDILDPKVSDDQAEVALGRLLKYVRENPKSPNMALAMELGEKAADAVLAYFIETANFHYAAAYNRFDKFTGNLFSSDEDNFRHLSAAMIRLVNIQKRLPGSSHEPIALEIICSAKARIQESLGMNAWLKAAYEESDRAQADWRQRIAQYQEFFRTADARITTEKIAIEKKVYGRSYTEEDIAKWMTILENASLSDHVLGVTPIVEAWEWYPVKQSAEQFKTFCAAHSNYKPAYGSDRAVPYVEPVAPPTPTYSDTQSKKPENRTGNNR